MSRGERIGYSQRMEKGQGRMQSLIMTAELNGLSPWKYLEWLLTGIKELEAPNEEDFARYLPWSEEAQEKCKIDSICTEKYQHYFKKEA